MKNGNLMERFIFVLDLAQIRALVESTTVLSGSMCPSCEMPFDKGKKRRLIDSCGHERCYSCLFRSEACPLCLRRNEDLFNEEDGLEGPFRDGRFCPSGPLSMQHPSEDWIDDSSAVNSLCSSPRPRTRGPHILPRSSNVSIILFFIYFTNYIVFLISFHLFFFFLLLNLHF